MKIIDLDDFEGHWQPVRSAILATAGLLVSVCTARNPQQIEVDGVWLYVLFHSLVSFSLYTAARAPCEWRCRWYTVLHIVCRCFDVQFWLSQSLTRVNNFS